VGAVIYRREGDGFVLYSIGANLRDDGGKPPKRGSGSDSGDMVWRVESRDLVSHAGSHRSTGGESLLTLP